MYPIVDEQQVLRKASITATLTSAMPPADWECLAHTESITGEAKTWFSSPNTAWNFLELGPKDVLSLMVQMETRFEHSSVLSLKAGMTQRRASWVTKSTVPSLLSFWGPHAACVLDPPEKHQKVRLRPGIVMPACNSRTWEAEAGGLLLSLRPSYGTLPRKK